MPLKVWIDEYLYKNTSRPNHFERPAMRLDNTYVSLAMKPARLAVANFKRSLFLNPYHHIRNNSGKSACSDARREDAL